MPTLPPRPLCVALYRFVLAASLVGAVVSALAAFAPDATLRNAFVLVDRDDSRHYLEPAHLDALRVIAAGAALLLAIVGSLIVGRRERALRSISEALDDTADFARWLKREAPPPTGLTLWTVAALCALGAALRVTWLELPMQFDEADTYNFFASRNLFSLISDYTSPNNHILHNIFVHWSTELFGSSPPFVRLPAFLAGVVVMPLTYLLARRYGDESGALFATALVATSPPLVRYSAEARGYTMLAVCFLALCVIAPYLIERRSATLWTVFGALTVAGGFTIPVMLYPAALVSVWMVVSATPARRWRLLRELTVCGVASAAAAVALYSPAVARSTLHSLVANEYVASFTWPRFASKLQIEAGKFLTSLTMWVPVWCVALLIVGFAVSLFRSQARRAVAAAFVTIAAMMLAQRVVPYARVFYFGVPILMTLVGAGWSTMLGRAVGDRRALRASVSLCFALACLLGWRVWRGPTEAPHPTMRQYAQAREVAMRLTPRFGPDQTILSHPTVSDPIRFYLLRAGHSRGQVIVFSELNGFDRLDRYDKIWIVKRRDWQLAPEFLDAAIEPFSDPALDYETELLHVFSVDKRPTAGP